MKSLITGASGYIGQALTERLLADGHEVVHFVRRSPSADSHISEIQWDPQNAHSVDIDELGEIDAVFNLSGATVAKRWTPEYIELIRDSRIGTTETLVEICRRMSMAPKVLITASGLAIYGDRGDEQLTEESKRGDGILADIAVPWEESTAKASEFGVRTATARFGMVMGNDGGALPALAKPFRYGLGGRLGNGRQWTPWVHIDDAVSAMLFIAQNDRIDGPVIVASPGVVRNAELARAIANVLGRPSFGWMPAVVARLAVGNYIQELAIDSCLAVPEKLLNAGFEFRYRDIRDCLRQALG